jgi:hypothetical protein
VNISLDQNGGKKRKLHQKDKKLRENKNEK